MHKIQHLFASLLVVSTIASTVAADPPPASLESELLAVLQSTAPRGEKAISCKQLAIHGSAAAVPELSKLLSDPELSSWARIAIEAIPGDEANAALRNAAASLSGRLAIGMINSIGVRRDAEAVDLLVQRLGDQDPDVAAAAAVALGRIANPAAATALQTALVAQPTEAASNDATTAVRAAIAEGCVLSAEHFLQAGNASEAIEIYDAVRNADVPQPRIIEATRGAILARGEDGIPILKEQLNSPDRELFRLALVVVREFPGDAIDAELADMIAAAAPENVDPDRAALIIQAMADRPQTVVLPAVLQAATTGPKAVRLSAIDALRRIGDRSCLDPLIEIATDTDAELAAAAQETLAEFPGDQANEQIVAMLDGASGKHYAMVLDLIGRRRIDAVPQVVKGLDHADASIRHAALVALGETVSLDQLSILIDQVVSGQQPADHSMAIKALKAASIRMPDRDACAGQLAAALNRAPAASKTELMEILAEMGGGRALQTVAQAISTGDAQMLDDGSRLLGKWNSIDAAPVLLDLARSANDDKYRVRALRGYLGLARKFTAGEQRAEMCQTAIDAAIRPEEQQLALEVLVLRPDPAGLAVAEKAKSRPGLAAAAQTAAKSIAENLPK